MSSLLRRVAGPGLLLAVAGSLAVLHRQPPPPRPTQAEAAPSPVGLVPEPGWWVRRGAEIPLTAEQTRQVEAAAADWSRETQADQVELDRLGQSLNGQTRLDPDRRRAYSEASGRLAERRHAAWEATWSMLDATQRRRVEELRRAAPVEMR